MRQPEPLNAIDELMLFLDFAVPLCAAELSHKLRAWRYSSEQAETWLRGEAERAGGSLGANGDVLQFSDGRARSGRAQKRVVRTASVLARGVAAAALLAQLEGKRGVEAFGGFYGVPARPGVRAVVQEDDGGGAGPGRQQAA
ncbi:hypothetical protein [Streptomyces clavuligerus]|uniref:hypothetical protein n=1 Tax=Streptomyces clavuligerus TaxID=1901 RepID=UPI0012FF2CAE|nr:hypothetical protein [Streptomyces clavuligerus]WDN55868.1 hypothetical protein LL058_28635 [Streptomyces clavuligerus]